MQLATIEVELPTTTTARASIVGSIATGIGVAENDARVGAALLVGVIVVGAVARGGDNVGVAVRVAVALGTTIVRVGVGTGRASKSEL